MFQKRLIQEYIQNGFDYCVAKSEIDFVSSIVFNLSYVDILLNKNIPADFEKKLSDIVRKRIKTKRPIQQIVGMGYFLNEKYIVNENVLIPRPETEILVMEAKEIIARNKFKTFLDIGTGSGCISIALLKLCPLLTGYGVDISEKALEVAKKNAEYHTVHNRLVLKHSDLFSNIDKKFDIIISNPPYIPQKEKYSLQTEVIFDPEESLFTDDDEGIDIYKKIIIDADKYLNQGGYLMFEIGCKQGKLLRYLFYDSKFSDFHVIKDLEQNDRIVVGKL